MECKEDVPPQYRDLDEFLAAGGEAISDCELIPSSFAMISEVSDNRSCPETIVRTYSMTDECENEMECSQEITVHDKSHPVFAHKQASNHGKNLTLPTTIDCITDIPARFPDGVVGYNQFIAEFGKNNPDFITDNCGIDKSRFMMLSQVPKDPKLSLIHI